MNNYTQKAQLESLENRFYDLKSNYLSCHNNDEKVKIIIQIKEILTSVEALGNLGKQLKDEINEFLSSLITKELKTLEIYIKERQESTIELPSTINAITKE